MIKSAFLLLFFVNASNVYASCEIESSQLKVLLKLDDVGGDKNFNNSYGVSNNWRRVTEYIESNHIHASFGVIGDTLEIPNNFYYKWLKDRVKVGYIELWNHGYHSDVTKVSSMPKAEEFKGMSFDQQYESIQRTQQLATSKIGISFAGFGPHSSGIDYNTYKVLDSFSDIKYVWFYKPVDNKRHAQVVVEREIELENPIFRPNYESFKYQFSSKLLRNKYIALQGHPNMWGDNDFKQFTQIIDYLKDSQAVFCSPSKTFHLE